MPAINITARLIYMELACVPWGQELVKQLKHRRVAAEHALEPEWLLQAM